MMIVNRTSIVVSIFADRPEIFFKATPSRCVGPNGFIGIRSDSSLTATEPELAYVLDNNGEIIGYTLVTTYPHGT